LTDGWPRCSPDGRWVFYSSINLDGRTLWKVPIDGGNPVQVYNKHILNFAISADGKMIAYIYPGGLSKRKAAIIPVEGGEPIKTFDLPATATYYFIEWTPDGAL